MSSPKVRTLLTGIALVTTLSVITPMPTHAADLSRSTQDGDVLSLVWHWMANLWSSTDEAGGGHPGLLHMDSASTTDPAPTTSGTTTCGGDQGVCIDPNG
jgi:hypothetical protein